MWNFALIFSLVLKSSWCIIFAYHSRSKIGHVTYLCIFRWWCSCIARAKCKMLTNRGLVRKWSGTGVIQLNVLPCSCSLSRWSLDALTQMPISPTVDINDYAITDRITPPDVALLARTAPSGMSRRVSNITQPNSIWIFPIGDVNSFNWQLRVSNGFPAVLGEQ